MPTPDVINQIRQMLALEESVDQADVHRLYKSYCDGLKQAKERILACLDLLRRGERRQARELAEREPDLQETVRQLDFPERSSWLNLCERARLPAPEHFDPAALYRMAKVVYAESNPLDQLMRTHRRMALGGAPLDQRVRVLRQLKRADPEDRYWDDDIRTCEAALVPELFARAVEADKLGDLAALDAVAALLKAPGWLIPPSPATITAIEKAAGVHRGRETLKQLEGLIEPIRAAHEGGDRASCGQLLGQWQQLVDETGVRPEAAQEEAVEPARSWHEAEQQAEAGNRQYQVACVALDAALVNSDDSRELDRLLNDVQRFPQGVPSALRLRYEDRIIELTKKASRRFRIKLTATVGSLLIVAAAAVAAALYLRSEGAARDHEAVVESAVKKVQSEFRDRNLHDSSLTAAEAALAQLPPDVARRAAVNGLRIEFEAQRSEIKEQREAFSKKLTDVGLRLKSLEYRISQPVPQADATERLIEVANRNAAVAPGLTDVANELEELKKAAIQDSQRSSVEELLPATRQGQAALESTVATAFSAVQGELSAGLTHYGGQVRQLIASLNMADPDAASNNNIETTLSQGLALLERIRRTSLIPGLPSDNFVALGNMRGEVDRLNAAVSDAVTNLTETRTAMRRIATSYSDPSRLERELLAFAQQYPSSPLASDFLQAAQMAPPWRSVSEWNTLVRSWGRRARLTDGATAEKRLQQIDSYLSNQPSTPHLKDAEKYREYLTVAKDALAGTTVERQKLLLNALNAPSMAGLYMVRATGDRTYYLRNLFDLVPQTVSDEVRSYRITYIVDEMLKTDVTELPANQVLDSKPVMAPQSVFARKAIAELLRGTDFRWETIYLQLVQQTVEQEGMDPILKAQLLKDVLLPEAMVKTPMLPDKMKSLVTLLDGVRAANAAWMNPNDEDANRRRARTTVALEQMASLGQYVKEVAERVNDLDRLMACYRPVGVVLGTEKVMLADGLPEGTAYVLRTVSRGRTAFSELGTIKGGRLTIGGTIGTNCPIGTPVFMLDQ